jgi:M6 family metalloprotease-like protein
MGSSHPGLDHYWREVSYDNINLTGSAVHGWFNLPSPRSTYIQNDADLTLLANDCTAAADASVNFPDFVGINMMFNQDLDCCAWGGSRTLTLDGQTKTYRVTWMPPWAFDDQGVLAHEMGHGFGFPHSSGPYGQTYDSDWDVMSGIGICSPPDATFGCLGVHTISYHKDRLANWIPAERKFLAVEGTYHTLSLERLAQPPNNNNFLLAEIPYGSEFYTVEVRESAGYDNQLPGEGIIIHEVNGSRASDALVVDSTNNGDPNDDGARWTAGETFNDAANGISVAVNSSSGAFNITITREFVASSPTAFTDDIEGDTSGYFPQGTWAVTTADSHSSTHSWTDSPGGNYGNNVNSALFTPNFSLSGLSSPTLNFWNDRIHLLYLGLGTGHRQLGLLCRPRNYRVGFPASYQLRRCGGRLVC